MYYVHFKRCVSDFVTLYALFVWKYLFDNHKICAYALVVMLYGGASVPIIFYSLVTISLYRKACYI